MAWLSDTFGDGLSTLKGQISKITKEVLSDDPLAATSFEGRIKELEKQCSEQLTEIETLRRETKRLKEGNSFELTEDQIQQICEYENRLAELTTEKSELTQSLDRIEDEHLKELQTIIRDRDGLRERLTHQPINSDDTKYDELSAKFGNLQLQSDILFEENKSKEGEIRKYYEDSEKLKKTVAELELRAEQQSEKAFFAQQSSSNEIEILKQTIYDLEVQIKTTSQENDTTHRLNQLLEENARLKIEVENNQRELSTSEESPDQLHLKALEDKVTESRELIDRLEEDNEQLGVQLNEALSVKEKFEFKESVFIKKLEEAGKTIDQLSTENKILHDKCINLENSAADCSQLREEYEEKLRNMTTQMQRTEERDNLVSGSLASEIRALKTLLSRIRSEFLPAVDPQTENTEEVAQSQSDDVKRLLQDVSHMTEIIKTINQGLLTINLEKTQLEKEVQVLKTLLTKIEQELLANTTAKQQLETNILEWAAAVTNRDELIKNLSDEKTALTAELNSIAQLNQNFENEIETTRSKITELESKLADTSRAAEEWKTRLDSLQAIYETDTKRAEELIDIKDKQLTELRTNSQLENGEPQHDHEDQISRLQDENSDLKELAQHLRENIRAMNKRDVNKNHQRSHSQPDEITTETRYQGLLAENRSLAEKENNLRGEVERLRAHLLEVEDHYTEQAVTTESQLTEYRSKLAVLEDQLRNTSNVYKSANVRSSQQVEALQTQIVLMDIQRKDLESKLSAAEDNSMKQAAALASLQLVLEQFQLDKKRELQALLDKHAYQIELEQRRVKETETELEMVRQQLAEAKNGLKAALRLGEQLEKKNQHVSDLQLELNKSKDDLSIADSKLSTISESTVGKIDKSIIKNLMMGYLTAQGDHKAQTLKILSSVLELTVEERTRAGIDGQSGWLSHFRSPVSGSPSQGESLSQAFVRFLETESRPQPQLKLLAEPLTPGQQKRTPLVLSDLVLPSVTPTSVSDTGLDQVLKNS